MKIRWGIIGLGKIAGKFAEDLALVDGGELVAVGSRSQEKAEEFGQRHGAKYFHSSYEDLFKNIEVDIIYIATPHNSHLTYALKAMQHGKHVLCEKPLGINKGQVNQLIQASIENNVFLMEALWSRFNPTIRAVLQHIRNNEIGQVNYIQADFAFFKEIDLKSRLFSLDLAGGSLLDVGIYPIFLSYLIMGYPKQILATSTKHSNGIDLQMSALLKYDQGIAQVMSGLTSHADMTAKICGDLGELYIHDRWHEAQSYRMQKGSDVEHFELPTKGRGYTYEIEECHSCLHEGKTESDLWSHQDSLNLISIMDEIRGLIDLKYAFE